MVKRSRLEIYFDVLRVIMKGITRPTRIMYSANLSWNSIQEILTTLVQQGFIVEETVKNSKRYEITEKGERILSYYRKAIDGLTIEPIKTRR